MNNAPPATAAHRGPGESRPRWYATGWAMVACVAAARLVVYAFTANKYGYFRDELYMLACAEHLGWGYTDHPPMIALITWIARHTLGDSLWGLRLFPALAGIGTMFLTAAIARELGGRRFAQGLAALCILVAPVYLLLNYLLTLNAFEPLFWLGCAWAIILAIKRREPKFWLLFGLLAGLGLMNKYSTLVFGFGIAVGLVLTPARRFLASKWFWIGGALAFLILAPNIAWNIANDWPFIEFQREVGRDFATPAEFLAQQVLTLNPFTFPIWLLGLWFFFFSREGKPYRLFGWTFVVVLGSFIVLKGKIYYPMAIYPLLFAGGGVALERILAAPRRQWVKPASAVLLLASASLLAPLVLPILSVEARVRYESAFPLKAARTERSHYAAILPQYLADQFGWEEMTAAVARAYYALPPEERAKTAIIGNNFGECGAIDFFGPKYGLPKSIGVQQTYFLWGPRNYHGETLIVLGDRLDVLSAKCRSVHVAAVLNHPWAEPWENREVLVCHGLKWDLQEVWPRLKKYH